MPVTPQCKHDLEHRASQQQGNLLKPSTGVNSFSATLVWSGEVPRTSPQLGEGGTPTANTFSDTTNAGKETNPKWLSGQLGGEGTPAPTSPVTPSYALKVLKKQEVYQCYQHRSTRGRRSQAESHFHCGTLGIFQTRDLQRACTAQEPAPKALWGPLAWPTASVWEREGHRNKSLD